MEKLTDILARTGKATVRELAAIVKIDSADALNMLRELQEEGAVYRDGMHWSLPVEQGALPAEKKSASVSANAAPESTSVVKDVTSKVPTANQTPLKVIWSNPDDLQEFPTMAWVRQRRRELRNEMRWLSQIENIARQISRKKAAMGYFREQV